MSDKRRVILVTGGARRVGRHVCLHFARLGWDVAITYRTSADAMADLAEEVQRLGGEFVPIRADFEQPTDAAERVGTAVDGRLGRLDVLVHNASVYEAGDLDAVTLDTLRRDLAVHVETPLLLTKRLRPLLTAAKGSVIAMTDVDLDRSRPSFLTYEASKAALSNLMANLARELAPDVTANCIAPGAILWPPNTPEDVKATYLSRVPAGHIGSPADVAAAIEYLATTGRYVTGETLRLDGGRHLV